MTSDRNILLLLLINAIALSESVAQTHDLDSIHYATIAKPKKEINVDDKIQSVKDIEYFFYVQTGMLVGCNDCGKTKDYTFSAVTVHGAAIGKKLRAGGGFGFDSYQNWQTLPLFGMVSWDIIGNKTKNALFVQMNYGWAHPWFVRDGFYSNYSSDPFSNVKGGRMLNPQIGYRISYYNLKLSLVVGYKFQRITYNKSIYYNSDCLTCDFAQPSVEEITQDMNRVQLMISVGWK